jgi:hypothetical protein
MGRAGVRNTAPLASPDDQAAPGNMVASLVPTHNTSVRSEGVCLGHEARVPRGLAEAFSAGHVDCTRHPNGPGRLPATFPVSSQQQQQSTTTGTSLPMDGQLPATAANEQRIIHAVLPGYRAHGVHAPPRSSAPPRNLHRAARLEGMWWRQRGGLWFPSALRNNAPGRTKRLYGPWRRRRVILDDESSEAEDA